MVRDGTVLRERIGFLRQDPRFYTWMTGREVLQFTGRFFAMSPAEIDRQVATLLELVDLGGSAERKMGTYSGGMRHRLGIAQALMGRPQVLLDEPCSSPVAGIVFGLGFLPFVVGRALSEKWVGLAPVWMGEGASQAAAGLHLSPWEPMVASLVYLPVCIAFACWRLTRKQLQ